MLPLIKFTFIFGLLIFDIGNFFASDPGLTAFFPDLPDFVDFILFTVPPVPRSSGFIFLELTLSDLWFYPELRLALKLRSTSTCGIFYNFYKFVAYAFYDFRTELFPLDSDPRLFFFILLYGLLSYDSKSITFLDGLLLPLNNFTDLILELLVCTSDLFTPESGSFPVPSNPRSVSIFSEIAYDSFVKWISLGYKFSGIMALSFWEEMKYLVEPGVSSIDPGVAKFILSWSSRCLLLNYLVFNGFGWVLSYDFLSSRFLSFFCCLAFW